MLDAVLIDRLNIPPSADPGKTSHILMMQEPDYGLVEGNEPQGNIVSDELYKIYWWPWDLELGVPSSGGTFKTFKHHIDLPLLYTSILEGDIFSLRVKFQNPNEEGSVLTEVLIEDGFVEYRYEGGDWTSTPLSQFNEEAFKAIFALAGYSQFMEGGSLKMYTDSTLDELQPNIILVIGEIDLAGKEVYPEIHLSTEDSRNEA